jgi:predicted nucleotidyltransferase
MTTIYDPPSRPLENRKADVLRKVSRALGDSEAQPMLVGAFARDIWFWHLNGIETGRATEDIDISMAFKGWDVFRSFAESLKAVGFMQPDPESPEKLVDSETGQKLDMIPFGGVSADGRSITWHGNQARFSILGFEDSYKSAAMLPLDVEVNPRFRLATLPAIMTLKMISFYERLEERKRKDGDDIGFTMTHYMRVGDNVARLGQGADADIMNNVGGDLLRASSVLLGRDMARMAGPATQSEITSRLRSEISSQSNCPLAQELTRVTKGNFLRARDLLRDLLSGYETA